MAKIANIAEEFFENKKMIEELKARNEELSEKLEKVCNRRMVDHFVTSKGLEVMLVSKIRKTVDFRSIFKKLKVSKRMVDANTRHTAYTFIKVN